MRLLRKRRREKWLKLIKLFEGKVESESGFTVHSTNNSEKIYLMSLMVKKKEK